MIITNHTQVNTVQYVSAPPGKPRGPLDVSDITKNTCHLKWKPPSDDGGEKITHYQVERKEAGKPYWTTVASFCKVYYHRSNCKSSVNHLLTD